MTASAILNLTLEEPFVEGALHVLRHYDEMTYEHSLRVANLCAQLAELNGLDAPQTKTLVQAALLHDIGKIKIPKHITAKPARLTDEERTVVRHHVRTGFDVLRELDEDAVAKVIVAHHEFNVDSYPRQQHRGDDPAVDAMAQMLACADIYDSITRSRHYRRGRSRDEAREILCNDFKGDKKYIEQTLKLAI